MSKDLHFHMHCVSKAYGLYGTALFHMMADCQPSLFRFSGMSLLLIPCPAFPLPVVHLSQTAEVASQHRVTSPARHATALARRANAHGCPVSTNREVCLSQRGEAVNEQTTYLIPYAQCSRITPRVSCPPQDCVSPLSKKLTHCLH